MEKMFLELEREDLSGPAPTCMQLVPALSLTAQMADTFCEAINHPQHALSCLNINNCEEHLCDLEPRRYRHFILLYTARLRLQDMRIDVRTQLQSHVIT